MSLSSAIDPDARSMVSPDDLIDAASADALAAASARVVDAEDFPKLAIVRAATKVRMAAPDLHLVPDGTDPSVSERCNLVRELVEDAVDAARVPPDMSEGTIGFDDLLLQLRRARRRGCRCRGRRPTEALQDRAHRRVPGHRPGPVGHLLRTVRPTRIRQHTGVGR